MAGLRDTPTGVERLHCFDGWPALVDRPARLYDLPAVCRGGEGQSLNCWTVGKAGLLCPLGFCMWGNQREDEVPIEELQPPEAAAIIFQYVFVHERGVVQLDSLGPRK